jgi:single-strand DNA-binding protein
MVSNHVTLIGRITKDLELKTFEGDSCVLNFSIAVNRRKKADADHPEADFINLVAWNKPAEIISKYFKKGNKIAVSGRIQTRKYEDKEGKSHTAFEVVIEEFEFVEKRDTGEAPTSTSKPVSGNNNENFDEIDNDDLPF